MLVEKHHADETGDRRRDGIDGNQQCLVCRAAANDRIRLDGEQQAKRQRKEGDQHGEYNREFGDAEIFGAEDRIGIVGKSDEGGAKTERVFNIKGRMYGLNRRPVEEDENHRKLRRQKQVGHVGRGELHALHAGVGRFCWLCSLCGPAGQKPTRLRR